MNLKLINSNVNAILRGCQDMTLPIDIEKIAKARGVEIVPFPMTDGVSGMLAIQEGKATIGYNQSEGKLRSRFTIAHELGHYELHKDKSHLFVDKQFIYRSQSSGDTPDNKVMEQEANYFASAILMPTSLLRREIDKIDIDLRSEEAIDKLARIFQVSPTAMTVRISSLGLL